MVGNAMNNTVLSEKESLFQSGLPMTPTQFERQFATINGEEPPIILYKKATELYV